MAAEQTTTRAGSDADAGVGWHSVRDQARLDLAAVLATVDAVPVRAAMRTYGDLRAMIDAAQATRLADDVTADGDTTAASRKAASDRRVSKRSARAAAKRAKAVKKNPKLADKVADGSLSGEQLDTIADAMDTNESAATDQDLIDKVANSSADQGRQHGRDWATKHASGNKNRLNTTANDPHGAPQPGKTSAPDSRH